jgi:hypothetical protein
MSTKQTTRRAFIRQSLLSGLGILFGFIGLKRTQLSSKAEPTPLSRRPAKHYKKLAG